MFRQRCLINQTVYLEQEQLSELEQEQHAQQHSQLSHFAQSLALHFLQPASQHFSSIIKVLKNQSHKVLTQFYS